MSIEKTYTCNKTVRLQGPQLTADNRGLGSAILFHETSGIGPEPMLFGDGTAITHPGATDARVSRLWAQRTCRHDGHCLVCLVDISHSVANNAVGKLRVAKAASASCGCLLRCMSPTLVVLIFVSWGSDDSNPQLA